MTILLKILKWCALSVATVFILGWLFVWLVASGSEETTVYTEHDFFHYHTLTDKDIEHAPRVTDDYYFEAHPGDGYAPSNSIVFKGATGVAPLRAYLETLGYAKEKRRLGKRRSGQNPNR
jgi:phage portal protein BeeE